MFVRKISEKVLMYAKQFPIITITGPRQSGKTTLCKMLFPLKPYVSLEGLDDRQFAQSDPRGFLSQFPNGAVIDEVQRAPELFSYLQSTVDAANKEGMFVLTGSQQFEMMASISQSLAGRTAVVKLLPFSISEIYQNTKNLDLHDVMFTGFYPRIFDKKIPPSDMYAFYINTYLEKDVRQVLQIKDMNRFEAFLKLCAGRTGQLLNTNQLGNECDVNHNTIKSWLSVLEASYIIKLVYPFSKNINKRIVKSPKLFFLDTGLAAHLMGIRSADHIKVHPLQGSLFETLVVCEFMKHRFNNGILDPLYFYRDQNSNEVDLLQDNGISLDLIEIKMAKTIRSDFFKGIQRFPAQEGITLKPYLIYGGDRAQIQQNTQIYGWQSIPESL